MKAAKGFAFVFLVASAAFSEQVSGVCKGDDCDIVICCEGQVSPAGGRCRSAGDYYDCYTDCTDCYEVSGGSLTGEPFMCTDGGEIAIPYRVCQCNATGD